jgi:hypothetical protein
MTKKDILTPEERKSRQDFLDFLDNNNIAYTINPENESILIDVKKSNQQLFDKEELK